MDSSRRFTVLSIAGVLAAAAEGKAGAPQVPVNPDSPRGSHVPDAPEPGDQDYKLPNGKSQRDAIAAKHHKEALKDAVEMQTLANEVKSELDQAGDYVVSLSTLKKTEEIEKLARRIRDKLKS